MRYLPLILLVAVACRSKDDIGSDSVLPEFDGDGDGYVGEDDCDDSDAGINPGVDEQPYDGLDNDCDPSTADDDLDGDGFAAAEDCDDADAAVNPDAEELCDGIDNDCDGEVDVDATDASTWFADGDGDGYGSDLVSEEACEAPEGYVEVSGDCDDADAAFNPAAEELDCSDPNDYNCDGSVGFADNDGDGYAACEECDDSDRAVNPSATEVCDGVDNDCNGDIDSDAIDRSTFYSDGDGDGYGDPSAGTEACDAPSGTVADDSDCDDGDAAINSGATEVCNDIDDDCDGDIDVDATDATAWYGDGDGDGYGNAALTQTACDQPSGYVDNADDCDDGEPLAWTGASETCDSVDNDCDSSVDEGVITTWFVDADSDGFGNSRFSQDACTQPSNYVADSTDCDDGESAVNPGATEVCNDIDDDCDGLIDDADTSLDASTGSDWYTDADADGYGDASSASQACEQPSGSVADDTDCDDSNSGVNPGEVEICDTLDNDCDGQADGGLLGADASCAAESCNEILLDGSSSGDGQYYLDPEGDGGALLYDCDMSTDGGGWTRITYWNREDDGDGYAELLAEMTETVNQMGLWDESTNANYIRYNDYDQDSDVLAYYDDVEVPNGGEALLDLHYTGQSMECSAVWFYVDDVDGGENDMYCREDLPPNCSHATASGAYGSADLAYAPSYTCGVTADDTWTWQEAGTFSMAAEITRFNWRSLMFDANGDFAYIYRFDFYVR